jgi:hypothetical protein
MSVRRDRFVFALGILVATLFFLAGIFETTRVLTSGDGGLAFWFGSLMGGGALVLFGTLALRAGTAVSNGVLIAGVLLGVIGTAWTVIVPLIALTFLALRLTAAPAPARPSASPSSRD